MTMIVGAAVPTTIAGTRCFFAAVPTSLVGTAVTAVILEKTVTEIIVGTTVPTMIVGKKFFGGCFNNFC